MTDIVLASIPRISPSPQTGVLYLVDSVKNAGYTAEFYDANLQLYKKYVNHLRWKDIETWGIQQHPFKFADQELQQLILSATEQWAEQILSYNPKHVGISVFSIESRNWAEIICYKLKLFDPTIKILMGGKGINDPGSALAYFAENCLQWQLIDGYLNGESEFEIVDYLQGNSKQLNVIDVFHVPDNIDRQNFSTFDPGKFEEYLIDSNWYEGLDDPAHTDFSVKEYYKTNKTYATRGCVKRCTFCDVHLLRPKFGMRSPQNIVDEFKYAYENFEITEHYFNDEMVNGSNKQFMAWMRLLVDYLEETNISNFSWRSQFGIKQIKTTPDEMFELIAKTNGKLSIGVDHFSDNVLRHMNKLYTQQDIFGYLDKLLEYNIKIDPFMIIASYPTETKEDFEIVLQCVSKLKRYKSIIVSMDLGNLCSVPTNSELERLPGMHMGSSKIDWYYEKNPELTVEEKLRRRQQLDQAVESIGLTNRKKRTYWLRMQSWLNQ